MVNDARPGLSPRECGERGDRRGRFDGFRFRDEERTCILIASGPSAIGCLRECTGHWRSVPAGCVNDSWRLHPGAQLVYAADGRWWEQRDTSGLSYAALVREYFKGHAVTCDKRAAAAHGIELIEIERAEGLSTTPGVIRTGGMVGNSGAQLINLATLYGAHRLLLVGFDMRNGENNQTHWFGDHPKPLRNDSNYKQFIAGMGQMAADLSRLGIEVINCSPVSALPFWPKRALDAVLPSYALDTHSLTV